MWPPRWPRTAFSMAWIFCPTWAASDHPAWIGSYSQLGDPPLYYALAAIPLRIARDTDVTTQLYLGRLTSLGLYLLTLVIAWGLLADLTPLGSPLRWMVPLSMALLPGFVELMTALNSDAGAVAAFSWFLWGGLRWMRRPWSWLHLVWTLTAAVLCWFVKANVYVALPLVLVAMTFASLARTASPLGLGAVAGGWLAGDWADLYLGRTRFLVSGE